MAILGAFLLAVVVGAVYTGLISGVTMLMLGGFADAMGSDAWALGFWQTFWAVLIIRLVTAPVDLDVD